MLTRRQLRIKALQALYAYKFTESSMQKALNALENSVEYIFDLYLLELKALKEFRRFEEERLERGLTKKIPTESDLNPNKKMLDNVVLKKLANDRSLQNLIDEHKIRWGDDRDVLQNIYLKFIQSSAYIEYLESNEHDVEIQRQFVKDLYAFCIGHNEIIHEIYEARNIHWTDDLEAVQMMVVSTINMTNTNEEEFLKLVSLFKDEEDQEYYIELLRKTIQNDEYFEELISEKAQNWDGERIAVIDKLLMKLALAELIYFSQIPIKVTFNEYIELSKQFSTSKSGVFINGVLDKLSAQLTKSGEVRKIGRGLL
jgi:transcription antitermination protein NusB